MILIGLTGPTGAGKGEVAAIFSSFGIPTLNADQIYHDLLVPPSECLDELVGHFGDRILFADRTLNRKALGSIVFSDKAERQYLNRVSHRYVMERVKEELARYRNTDVKAVVLDAPQLFEAGADADCDVVISVLSSPETRMSRIMARDRIDESSARARMAAQFDDAYFASHSDYIISNDASIEDLIPEVRNILKKAGVLSE